MVQRLRKQSTVEGEIHTILDDVIALHGAEYGNVQLPIGNELVIVAQRGLSADFLKTFRRVLSYDGTACGRALRSGEIVQIIDVEKDPGFAAYRMDAARAGFRSVQSTPFLTKDGRLMGVVSVHFANPTGRANSKWKCCRLIEPSPPTTSINSSVTFRSARKQSK
jgi:hypothetical protein